MAEEVIEQIRDIVESPIDFKGQILAERVYMGTSIIFGIIAFIYGYAKQDIQACLFIMLAGLVTSIVLVVPPWPIYNKNPITWTLPHGAIPVASKEPVIVSL